MKTCHECSVKKELNEFYKNKTKNDGYDHICKECAKRRAKKYLNNRSDEKIKQHRKKKILNYEKNKKATLIKKKEYYIEHLDYILQKRKEYAKLNKDKLKNDHTKYYHQNIEKISKQNKENYARNKDVIVKRNVRYEMNRRRIDPYYKFYKNLRCRFKNAMKLYAKNGKVNSCKEYGIDFKKIYEKVGISPGKEYHLDHIIPLIMFDLNNNEHIRLAHLPVNLRWITATDNLIKNNKIPDFAYNNPELLQILVTIGKGNRDEKDSI